MLKSDAIEILETMQNNLEETRFLERCAIDMGIEALKERPYGEWVHAEEYDYLDENGVEHFYIKCPNCGFLHDCFDCHTAQYNFCPNCGASMSANDRQVTSKLNSENECEAKVKELEDAIAKCEQAEKEFKSRTCKFRSPINCDFCSFHSDCEEHLKEGNKV